MHFRIMNSNFSKVLSYFESSTFQKCLEVKEIHKFGEFRLITLLFSSHYCQSKVIDTIENSWVWFFGFGLCLVNAALCSRTVSIIERETLHTELYGMHLPVLRIPSCMQLNSSINDGLQFIRMSKQQTL